MYMDGIILHVQGGKKKFHNEPQVIVVGHVHSSILLHTIYGVGLNPAVI